MNEEYLKGYFNTYVLPKKQDATYDDWVSKIKDNEQYKQGMFNTYVLPKKQDATYDDWNTKVFGSDLTGATARGKVVPKTETPSKPTTTGYSENITNFVTAYQKDPKTAMQLLPTISEEEIKATPLNSMVKESIIKAKKNLELSNHFGEPILQAGVMRGVEVKAKQKEKYVPTLSFASIYKEAEKQKEDITIPYSSQEQTVTPLPKEDILKANLTLINSYLSKGDVDSYNTALKMTKIQAEKYPYLKSYANRLESYIKRKEGDFEGAAKSYDNIEDDSKTISDFNISAYSKVKAGKVEEANEDIDKAIERGNPSDINDIDDLIYSWQLKGNMAYNAGSTELMEQASSKIKELKYAKDRATKDNVFTIFTKTPLTQEEWDKQYKIVQNNIITSPILGAAEAAGMALQGVYEMSTPPPKDKVYTKEEYDKEKNDRVLLGYSKALNGMVSTAFNTFPSIYLFNVGIGAIGEAEKEYRNKQLEDLQKYTNMPMEALKRAKEEEGVIDTVSKWIFAPLTSILEETGVYDKMNETQRNFTGLGDVTATILGLSLAHKGVSALKKNLPPAIEDYIKSEDKFTTDKGVQEFREGEAKVEATAEKIKNIDIDKVTLDAIMEMKKEAEPIIAVMDKINKGEAITEAEGKLVVDFIDQTMKDPEFIIKTFKKEPIQVEKKVDNSVQGNLNRLRTEEANIVNKKEYAGIDDLYKAEELGSEIAALNEKVNKVIAEKTKAVQEQIDLLKEERNSLYEKEGMTGIEIAEAGEVQKSIDTRLQPLLKEKQNIINEVYKLDITELDNILKPKEEAKPITIDEQIAKTEDIINKEGVTDLTEGGTKGKIEGAIDDVKKDIIDGEEKKENIDYEKAIDPLVFSNEITGEEVYISIPEDVVKAASEMSQAERAKAEGILREQANDKYNEEIKKSIAEEEIPLTETTYNFESVKQENIDRYDYYKKEVDGVTKYFKKEKSAEIKPIRQLGTGANVYFETKKYRVNDWKKGKVLLNVGDRDGEIPLKNIEFDNVNEAVFVAKRLNEEAPDGLVHDYHNIDKIINNLKKEYLEYEKTRTETQEAVTKPIKGKEQWKGIVVEEGDILSETDFISKVVSESTSPNELARAYNMEMELIPEQRLNLWQKALSEMTNGNISTESFYRHGDRNKTNRTLAKRFLRKNGKPLDTFIIEDLAEAMNAPEGYEMPTPSEVAEFMIDMTSGRVSTRKTSDKSRILASRYKELTGKNIKDHDFKDKRYQLEGDINAEIDATEIPKRWYDDAEMIGDKLSGDINKDDITLDNLDKIEAEAADFMFDSDIQKKEYFQKIRNFLEHEKSRKDKQEANGTQEAGTPLPESSKMGAKPTEGTTAKAEVDSLKDVESTSKELKKLQSEDSEFIGDNFSNRETETHILGNIPFKEYKKGDIVNGKEVISDFGTSIKVKMEDPYRPTYTKPRMIDVFINKLDIENSIEGYKTISDYVSEAYHKAKADGSNPELVKAVEDLLGKKTEPEVSGKGKQQVENAYRLKQQAETKPVEEKQIVQPSPTTTTTTPKVDVVKKSSAEIAKEITTKEKIAEANAIIGDELSKLMNQIGIKKGLLPEDKVNIKRLITAIADKTGLEIKLVIENMKAYLEKEYPSSKKEVNDVLDEVIKEQETTTTPELSGIKHADTAKDRSSLGMEEYEGGLEITEKEAVIKAKKWIADGGDVRTIIDKLKNNKNLELYESAVIGEYKNSLSERIAKNPTPELLKEHADIIELTDKSGTSWSETGLGRKLMSPKVDNLANFLFDRSKDKGYELTPEQIKEETTAYNELKKKNEELEVAMKLEQDKVAKLEAEKEFRKIKNKTTRESKKTHEEYVIERKNILSNMRESLRKSASVTYVTLPLVPQLIAIAPHVKLLVESYAREGLSKLDSVINKIYDEIKDDIKGITKSDINDIISGAYNETKTRSQKLNQVRMIEKEASLLKELASARKNIEKVPLSKKGKENARILELQKKIKEVRKQNKNLEQTIDAPPLDKGLKTDKERIADREKFLLKKQQQLISDIKSGNYAKEPLPKPKVKYSRHVLDLMDDVNNLKQTIKIKRLADQQNKKTGSTIIKIGNELLAVKRLGQTAIDLSIMFRQLSRVTLNPRYFKQTANNFKAQLSTVFSPKKFARLMDEIHRDKDYHDMVEDNIIFDDLNTGITKNINEEYPRSILLKTKYIKEPFLSSNRAADAPLNYARFQLYKSKKAILEKQGIFRDTDPQAYKDMGNWVMNMTARGKLLKILENSQASSVLGKTFYGVRLMASQLNTLNPKNYIDTKALNPLSNKKLKDYDAVKLDAVKDMVGFTSGVILTGAAAVAAGAKVSFDPNDPDFLQVRFGDKVYDLTGGLAAYVRTTMRIMEAIGLRAESEVTGKNKGEADRASKFAWESTTRFFRNKLAPNTSSVVNLFYGKNTVGEEFNYKEFLEVYPMYADDFIKAMKEDGISSVATVLIPNLIGIGYGSYANKANRAFVGSDAEIQYQKQQQAKLEKKNPKLKDERMRITNIEKLQKELGKKAIPDNMTLDETKKKLKELNYTTQMRIYNEGIEQGLDMEKPKDPTETGKSGGNKSTKGKGKLSKSKKSKK